MMKIAIDIRASNGTKAGKGWYTLVMVKELLKRDTKNQYLLYTNELNPSFAKYTNARQVEIKKSGLSWHLAVRRDLKRTRPDVFWAPTSYILPAIMPRGIRTVITVHDVIAFIFPDGHDKKALWLERLTLHRAIKRADHISTVSRSTKNDLMKMFHVQDKKVDIAPCASSSIFKPVKDRFALNAVREKYNLPEKFILGLGTLSPRKNFTRLIKAYAQTLPKHPDVHLVIVGPKGWNCNDLIPFEQSDKVHFIGYVDGEDIAALYSLAKIFVFPSLYEGFGIPPLEAMACGCPVITSNVSSLPEVVGNSAMLIDPYSVEDIANAIDIILSNAYIQEDLREKGLFRARKFSWGVSAERVLDLFESKPLQ